MATDAMSYEVAKGMVEHGSVAMSREILSLDAHRGVDGRFYSPYGIGHAIYGVPFYWAGRLAEMRIGFAVGRSEAVRKAAFVVGSAVAAALVVWLTYLFAYRWSGHSRASAATALTLAFATLLWPYAKFGFNAPLSALAVLGGVYGAWTSVRTDRLWLAVAGGAAFGFALLVRPELALGGAVTMMWAAVELRRASAPADLDDARAGGANRRRLRGDAGLQLRALRQHLGHGVSARFDRHLQSPRRDVGGRRGPSRQSRAIHPRLFARRRRRRHRAVAVVPPRPIDGVAAHGTVGVVLSVLRVARVLGRRSIVRSALPGDDPAVRAAAAGALVRGTGAPPRAHMDRGGERRHSDSGHRRRLHEGAAGARRHTCAPRAALELARRGPGAQHARARALRARERPVSRRRGHAACGAAARRRTQQDSRISSATASISGGCISSICTGSPRPRPWRSPPRSAAWRRGGRGSFVEPRPHDAPRRLAVLSARPGAAPPGTFLQRHGRRVRDGARLGHRCTRDRLGAGLWRHVWRAVVRVLWALRPSR